MFDRLRHRPFAVTVVVALVVKLWLTADIAIVPYPAPYDASNFVEHAKWIAMGRWFGPYDALTLIKGPTFPLFLALVREFGIPFPLAHQLLYFVASLVACIAIRPIVRDERALAACFLVLFFNPDTYEALAWLTYRSVIGGSLTLLAFACAVALLLRRTGSVRRSWPWSIGLAVSFSAFWLNREEGVWLVPAMLVLLAPVVVLALREARRASFERLATVALPLLLLACAIKVICVVNGRVYGWPTVVEIQSPEFVSAYAALARISHPPADRRFPVPRSARAIAYSVSPAAAELRPVLEGPATQWARDSSCDQFSACGDFAGGWFLWALRQGVAVAGHDRNGATARAYYVELASEIDRACDAGAIRCERKRLTLAPPIAVSDVGLLAHNFSAGVLSFATLRDFSPDRWHAGAPPDSLVDDYRFVTGSEAEDPARHFEGWIVAPNAETIVPTFSGKPDADTTIVFSASPDVARALEASKRFRDAASFSCFEVTTERATGSGLEITERDGSHAEIPLDVGTRDVRTPNIMYHLEPAGDEQLDRSASYGVKHAIQRSSEFIYSKAVAWLALFAVWLALCDLARPGRIADRTQIVLAALVGLVAVIAVLTVIQTFSFLGFSDEYFSSPRPLLLLIAVLGLQSIGAVAGVRTGTYPMVRMPSMR